jgi:hypothetical protein
MLLMTLAARCLLAFSSFVFAIGGLMHAAAFSKTLAVIAKSNLPAFFANSFKMLWIADSATLLILAAIFASVAAWPHSANRVVLALLALVPAATAALMYAFIGPFFAIPLLLAPAMSVWVAVLLPVASASAL